MPASFTCPLLRLGEDGRAIKCRALCPGTHPDFVPLERGTKSPLPGGECSDTVPVPLLGGVRGGSVHDRQKKTAATQVSSLQLCIAQPFASR
jgi:hypothetical protein